MHERNGYAPLSLTIMEAENHREAHEPEGRIDSPSPVKIKLLNFSWEIKYSKLCLLSKTRGAFLAVPGVKPIGSQCAPLNSTQLWGPRPSLRREKFTK